MIVEQRFGDVRPVLDHAHLTAREGAQIHAKRVFEEVAHQQRFEHAGGGAGVGLLGGDDVADVIEPLVQGFKLLEDEGALGGQGVATSFWR